MIASKTSGTEAKANTLRKVGWACSCMVWHEHTTHKVCGMFQSEEMNCLEQQAAGQTQNYVSNSENQAQKHWRCFRWHTANRWHPTWMCVWV